MAKEDVQNNEAEERGETAPVQEEPQEVGSVMAGRAIETDAHDLVAGDSDRPVADNKLPAPESPVLESAGGSGAAPPNVDPPQSESKRRGRPKMTDQEKAQAKAQREAFKAGKPPPDFSGMNKPMGGMQPNAQPQSARNYYLEACDIFFPVSFAAEKWLGAHWGIPIEEKEIAGIMQKCLSPTDGQKNYLAHMARWLEYEQFGQMNPRYAFLIASVGYVAPLMKTEPTPTRLKSGWEWVRVNIFRRQPNPRAKHE